MSISQEQLQEMWEWYQARKQQQIAYPLDDASRNSLGVPADRGPGSTPTTQIISGTPASVPTNPVGTILLESNGVRYEIPYLKTI